MSDSKETSLPKQLGSEVIQVIPKAYDDLIKPAACELGKGLQTIAKSVNVVLMPLAGVVWGFERLQKFLAEEVSRKLEERNTKKIVTPAPSVAVPTLSALRYLGNEVELRNLFANLLVSVMDDATAAKVHPSFVEIIKQLSADEAIILSSLKRRKYFPVICEITYDDGDFFDPEKFLSATYVDFNKLCDDAGVKHGETGHYLDNLLRLRLLELKESGDVELKQEHPFFHDVNDTGVRIERSRYEGLSMTKLGIRFLDMCVCPKTV